MGVRILHGYEMSIVLPQKSQYMIQPWKFINILKCPNYTIASMKKNQLVMYLTSIKTTSLKNKIKNSTKMLFKYKS